MKMCYVLVAGVRASPPNSSSIHIYVGTRCYHCIDASGSPRNPRTRGRKANIHLDLDKRSPQSTHAWWAQAPGPCRRSLPLHAIRARVGARGIGSSASASTSRNPRTRGRKTEHSSGLVAACRSGSLRIMIARRLACLLRVVFRLPRWVCAPPPSEYPREHAAHAWVLRVGPRRRALNAYPYVWITKRAATYRGRSDRNAASSAWRCGY